MRRHYMADISHELRTPLAIILAELEALADGIRPLSKSSILSLTDEAQHINKIVSDLHELALSDVGALKFSFEELDIRKPLQKSLSMLGTKFQKRELTIESNLPQHAPIISGDELRLQQLFTNLFENSIRYTHMGGTIKISMLNTDSNIVVIIEDSEPGVPFSQLKYLFDRFYKLDDSRNRDKGGTGLGLALCRKIMEAHDGSIKAEPSSLGGLKISINFSPGK